MNYRKLQIPPCRPYEIAYAEAWLSDMAAHGLHLEKDGFAFGLAFFVRGAPSETRYRFDIAKPETLFEDGGVEAEQAALYAASGWEYVSQWGDFCIFRCTNPETSELHTDAALHAAALKRVRRGTLSSLLWISVLVVLWCCLICFGTSLLNAVLGKGLLNGLLSAAIMLWGLYLSFSHYLVLRAADHRLRAGLPIETSTPNWKRRAGWRKLSFVLSITLILAWLGTGFVSFLRSAGEDHVQALEGNEASLPFALMQDFYPDSTFTYSSLSWTNEIETRRDIGIPVHLYVSQNGVIRTADGTKYDGGLTVRYLRTVSSEFTALLEQQYLRHDEKSSHFDGYDALPEACKENLAFYGDALRVYLYTSTFPTILMVYDTQLLHITYYSAENQIPAWVIVQAMAAHICG